MGRLVKTVASDDRRFLDAANQFGYLIKQTKDERTIPLRERFIRFNAGDWLVFKQEPEYPRYMGRFDNLMSAVFCALK